MVIWPPTHAISNHYPWYVELTTNGISTSFQWEAYQWYFDPSTYGISNPLSMVYWNSYPWYFDPLAMAYRYRDPYPWYIKPPSHGISDPKPWYFDTLSMVFWPSIHDILNPLPMVFGHPTNGILEPPLHSLLNPQPIEFWPPTYGIVTSYSWYVEPLTNGISIILSMVF